MANITDLVKNLIPVEFTAKAASRFGESEDSVKKVIDAGIPAVLAGLLSKSETTDGAHTVHKLATEAADSNVVESPGALFSENAAHPLVTNIMSMLSKLFSDRWVSIINMISNFAGVKKESATGLLGALAPVILSALGQKVKTDNLSASGLASWLVGQKQHIADATPSGFNLASALGLTSLGSLGLGAANMASGVKKPDDTPAVSYKEEPENKTANKWLLPLLLLIGIGALAWYLMKDRNKNEDMVATEDTVVNASATTTTTTTTTTHTLAEVVLPDGTKLQAYPGGIEDQLVKFIQSDEYKNATNEQLKDKWFNFDDLNFEFGTATPTAESKRQLDNITAILKAFPDVKIKIGGYTDKKGDDAANKKLSDERAKTVQKTLQNAGVGAQVPEAEGYGEEFATVDENASDEARMIDRKTAVRLVK